MKKQRVLDVDLSGELSPRCCCVERGRNGIPSHLSSSGAVCHSFAIGEGRQH